MVSMKSIIHFSFTEHAPEKIHLAEENTTFCLGLPNVLILRICVNTEFFYP